MPSQESTPRERGTTDVALSARAMTFSTVIVERFFDRRRVHIRANSLEVRPVTILVDVQTRRNVLNLLRVTKAARLFRILARFGNDVLVRGFFIRRCAIAAVTKDTPKFAVCGLDELGIAQEDFFPRFQRGHRAASTLTLRLC